MKIKYLAIVILILGLSLQFFRVNKLNVIVDTKQKISNNQEVVYSSAKNIPRGERKSLVLVSNEKGKSQEYIVENLKEVFGYSKTNYRIRTLRSLEKEEIYKYSNIIIATDNYKGLKKNIYNEIIDYIEKGGNLIILMNSYYNPFNKIAGIEKLKGFTMGEGLIFKKSIFPGIVETKIIGDDAISITNSLLDIELKSDVKIIAETSDGKPIIIERDIGEGRIIYSNATFFVDRSVNGILIQLISYGNDIFLQNIINTKIVHIDDFPAPFPKGKHKMIYPVYKLNSRDFFREIWWPDMKKLARDKNLIYTGFVIGTYEDITDADKFNDFDEHDLLDRMYFGRELLGINGEIGIHGYNHQPLGYKYELNQTHGYKDWKTEENMKASVVAIKDNLSDMYGGLQARVYVPPSNMIGATGKKILRENLPSLEVLSGLYSSPPEKGVLVTKIGWDKDEPTLYDFPRFTSGLIYSDKDMLTMYQGIAIHGVVSHFFHPDDLLSEERGQGKSWEELLGNLEQYFDNVNENFGFLRAQTSYEGFQEALKLEDLKVHTFENNGNFFIYFENFPGKTYHFFRIRDKVVKNVVGGKVDIISYDGETTLYLLEANDNRVVINLE